MKTVSRPKFAAAVSVLLLAALATGCSSFSRGWKAALSTPPPEGDFSGAWTGSWRSNVTGHHGNLRCLVARLDGSRYRARYKATYRKLFRFGYAVEMLVTRSGDGVFQFRGQADLGWWGGGVYRYEGTATATNYFATYQSKYDHGTFQMTRPGR
jgi:hypothetical protein